MPFGIGKSLNESRRVEPCPNVSRLSDSTARHAHHVTTSKTRTTRVQRRHHSVDWGGHVHLTFSEHCSWEKDANPEHKRLNLYTRALLLLRRPPCWNKHGSTRSTSRTCRLSLDVTWQAKWNFGLHVYDSLVVPRGCTTFCCYGWHADNTQKATCEIWLSACTFPFQH